MKTKYLVVRAIGHKITMIGYTSSLLEARQLMAEDVKLNFEEAFNESSDLVQTDENGCLVEDYSDMGGLVFGFNGDGAWFDSKRRGYYDWRIIETCHADFFVIVNCERTIELSAGWSSLLEAQKDMGENFLMTLEHYEHEDNNAYKLDENLCVISHECSKSGIYERNAWVKTSEGDDVDFVIIEAGENNEISHEEKETQK